MGDNVDNLIFWKYCVSKNPPSPSLHTTSFDTTKRVTRTIDSGSVPLRYSKRTPMDNVRPHWRGNSRATVVHTPTGLEADRLEVPAQWSALARSRWRERKAVAADGAGARRSTVPCLPYSTERGGTVKLKTVLEDLFDFLVLAIPRSRHLSAVFVNCLESRAATSLPLTSTPNLLRDRTHLTASEHDTL